MIFQGADTVAGYGELRVLCVFERKHDLPGEPRIDLVKPVDVDQCGTVDA